MSETERKKIVLTRSAYAESIIRWDGKPLSLKNYPQFVAPYDGLYKKVCFKTSRQVGKSIKLMVDLLTDSCSIPHFKSMFVTPSESQTNKFSNLRIGKAILFSPHIRDNYIDASRPNAVLTRSFTNGSDIVFTYAMDDGDRVRGNSADHILCDETQDILLDAVRPEIKECLRESTYRRESFCGTPKTMENGLEGLWQNSTQDEWVIPCTGCNKHSIILSETQLGKWGPVCGHCKKYLNPRLGFWMSTNPNKDVTYKGFHISRPIMFRGVAAAWNDQEHIDAAKTEWTEIMSSLSGPEAYPISKFRNEVLGVSDSMGTRLVTREMLEAAMKGPPMCEKPTPELMRDVTRLAAGIDWSGGGENGFSNTVVVILGKLSSGGYRVLFFKIFSGLHPVKENEEIVAILKNYDIKGHLMIGGDAGEGNMNMDMLRSKFDNPARVVKFRYVGPQAQHYLAWHPRSLTYRLNRTVAHDSTLMGLVRGETQFPREPKGYVDIAFKHILAEYVEVTDARSGSHKVWRHAATNPDDFLQALIFARTTLQIATSEIQAVDLGSAAP